MQFVTFSGSRVVEENTNKHKILDAYLTIENSKTIEDLLIFII